MDGELFQILGQAVGGEKKVAASYGHKIYAARKEGIWRGFAKSAVSSFLAVGVEI